MYVAVSAYKYSVSSRMHLPAFSSTHSSEMEINSYFVDPDRGRNTSNANYIGTKPIKPIRKKFAVPPVKVACLEWQVNSQSSIVRFSDIRPAERPERDAMGSQSVPM
jgi:hypothetical protein